MSDPKDVIDKIKQVTVNKPADIIVKQIKDLIRSGDLKPGDRLPAERAFAEKFGVGRAHVREALKQLEVYGIINTLPQSGTYVASLGPQALEDLISEAIGSEKGHLDALLETRQILEVNAARLAAEHASREAIIELIRIHESLRGQIKTGNLDPTEDHRFHLKIAALSKNPVLCSLVTLLVRNTDDYPQKKDPDTDDNNPVILKEHEAILQAIKLKNPNQAARAMEAHMETVLSRYGPDK